MNVKIVSLASLIYSSLHKMQNANKMEDARRLITPMRRQFYYAISETVLGLFRNHIVSVCVSVLRERIKTILERQRNNGFN